MSRIATRLVGWIVFVGPLTAALPAFAQSDSSAFDRLVGRAVNRFQSGQYLLAAQDFEAAFAIEEEPTLIFNQARALEKALKLEDSLKAYERYVALPGTTAELRGRALNSIAALRGELEMRERMAKATPATKAAAPPTPSSADSTLSTAPQPGPNRTLEWALVGSGAALLVGGGVMGVLALDKSNELDDALELQQAPRSEVESIRDEANRNGVISDVLLISGGVVAATGLVLFLVNGSSDSDVALTPALVKGGGGMVLGGRF